MAVLVKLLLTLIAALTLSAPPNRLASLILSRVHEVDVRSSSGVSRQVTDPAQVARIVRWFEALPADHRRGIFACPLIRADSPTVRFDFRGASGSVVAQARMLDAFRGFSGPCNPIAFSILGHRQTPRIGGSFLLRVQRLLGVRFG
jgi:hypothetical protein